MHRVMGLGHSYRFRMAKGETDSLQWISAAAQGLFLSAVFGADLFFLSCQNVVER